jgi:adenylosuccinate synthase
VERWPASAEEVGRATPIYERFPGWPEEIHDARTPDDLPTNARAYIGALEALAGVPIRLVSVGPERTQTVVMHDRPLEPAGGAGGGARATRAVSGGEA